MDRPNTVHWITRSDEIARIREQGLISTDRIMIIIRMPNQTELTRFAVIASKSVGGAVQRNRCKRILRACIRQNLAACKSGFDVLYIARKPLLGSLPQNTVEAFKRVSSQAQLL